MGFSLPPTAPTPGRPHRGERFPSSTPEPEPSSRHLHAGHPPGQDCRHPPGSSQGNNWTLVSDCRRYAYDVSSVVHSRSPSRLTPDASRAPFPQRSPPRLIHRSSMRWFATSPCVGGHGGPTSITSAAPHPDSVRLHRSLLQRSWRTIIGEPGDDHVAPGVPQPPLPGPAVNDVVEVHVGEQRRHRCPLR